jgi:hypothetical protein
MGKNCVHFAANKTGLLLTRGGLVSIFNETVADQV